MDDLAQLMQMVTQAYGVTSATLRPMHRFQIDGRGIYRVDSTGGPPYLLRAYRQDETKAAWLAGRAASLLFLEQAGYPAPRVVRTLNGELVGRFQGWAGLLLTFVEGTTASDSLADYHAIGATLGRLHQLDPRQAATATPPIPPSRWQPASKISQWIADLTAIAGQIPPELRGLYRFSLETLQRVAGWSELPLTVLHTDCWAHNAIRTPGGEIILIDWDGAGLGPAVLDLGYLLVACHAFLPEWPHIVPHGGRISAVMEGYLQQRPLTEVECAVLPDALRFTEAFRAAQWLPTGLQGDWRADTRLRKFLDRYPVTDAIADLTRQTLPQR